MNILEVKTVSEIPQLPSGLSFFDPYLKYFAKEVLDVGGEVQVIADSGKVEGLFMYDAYEKTGSVYTCSREIFDHYFKIKPSSFLFSELDVSNIPRETFNIQLLNLERNLTINYTFKYNVSFPKLQEIERFMRATHPEEDPKWTRVALKNDDKCFVVKFGEKIVGCAWVSLVNGIGRFHTQYVKPQYRRMGIATDLFYARLLWLKMKGAKSVFSEISVNNIASLGVEKKADMVPHGRMYLYST